MWRITISLATLWWIIVSNATKAYFVERDREYSPRPRRRRLAICCQQECCWQKFLKNEFFGMQGRMYFYLNYRKFCTIVLNLPIPWHFLNLWRISNFTVYFVPYYWIYLWDLLNLGRISNFVRVTVGIFFIRATVDFSHKWNIFEYRANLVRLCITSWSAFLKMFYVRRGGGSFWSYGSYIGR